jgi:hypothetical protein
MVSLLETLLSTVGQFGDLVAWGVMSVINLVIGGFGATLAAVLSLLPGLPAVPTNPAPSASGYLAYFVDMTVILSFLGSLISMWILFLAIRPILKWVKGL